MAVKVIDKRKAKKDSYVTKNLRREGHIQQMIRHPNITQLLDILETENSYYLVMELCPGGNLMNRIYDKKRLDERETQKYIRQLVLAVEHLHRAGVVHRCVTQAKNPTGFPGNLKFLLRAWELNFSHAGIAFVDNCLTGFLKLEDLRSTIGPEGSASMTHTGGAACLCQSNTEGSSSIFPIV